MSTPHTPHTPEGRTMDIYLYIAKNGQKVDWEVNRLGTLPSGARGGERFSLRAFAPGDPDGAKAEASELLGLDVEWVPNGTGWKAVTP
jgi:hypothetical protein